MTDPTSSPVGQRIGRYRVETRLGAGGTATVYRARTDDGEVIALKVFDRKRLQTKRDDLRFRREAKAASALHHPCIVGVRDWGFSGDYAFLAMDLVEGNDLYERLAGKGRLSPLDACEVAIGVLEGLAFAHERGVVHRDLKPENVLIESESPWRVRVTDFGAVKIRGSLTGDAMETRVKTATTVGMVIGTPSYMAPEQASGRQVDGRSDVYAVGVLLFEMMTGRLPFEGGDALEIASRQVREQAPSPRKYCEDIPQDLEQLVLRALSKRPDDRPQTAGAMRAALLRIVQVDEETTADEDVTRLRLPDIVDILDTGTDAPAAGHGVRSSDGLDDEPTTDQNERRTDEFVRPRAVPSPRGPQGTIVDPSAQVITEPPPPPPMASQTKDQEQRDARSLAPLVDDDSSDDDAPVQQIVVAAGSGPHEALVIPPRRRWRWLVFAALVALAVGAWLSGR